MYLPEKKVPLVHLGIRLKPTRPSETRGFPHKNLRQDGGFFFSCPGRAVFLVLAVACLLATSERRGDGELHNKPAHAVPLASARQHQKAKRKTRPATHRHGVGGFTTKFARSSGITHVIITPRCNAEGPSYRHCHSTARSRRGSHSTARSRRGSLSPPPVKCLLYRRFPCLPARPCPYSAMRPVTSTHSNGLLSAIGASNVRDAHAHRRANDCSRNLFRGCNSIMAAVLNAIVFVFVVLGRRWH